MSGTDFPVIDLTATGANIRRLRISLNLTVRDLQEYFGFAEPRVIYKWQKGECLPTVDNLFALSKLFGVTMDQILVQNNPTYTVNKEQQATACCSGFLKPFSGCFGNGKRRCNFNQFFRLLCFVRDGSRVGAARGSTIFRSFIHHFSGRMET